MPHEEPRRTVCRAFRDILQSKSVSYTLEACIYNRTIDHATRCNIPRYWNSRAFRRHYCEKVRSILFNLRNPKNPALCRKVREKIIKPERLVDMSPIELFPENWEAALEQVAKRRLRTELSIMSRGQCPDGIFQCKRCKSWKTVYYQLQTRSADEPMTTFVSCTNCGCNWKF